MTHKDYKLIAERLKELGDDIYTAGHASVFDRFIARLCADLKKDNANFDSAKFREKVYHG
jgi:hypothetical protein